MTEAELSDYYRRQGVSNIERQAINTEMQQLIDDANSKAPAPKEDQEQQALVNWLRVKGVTFHATPNGEYRKPITAKRLKAQGVQAGIPDLCIWPSADGWQPILWVELKRTKGGRVSPEQQTWIGLINAIGWRHNMKAKVCRGFEDARSFIESEGY